MFKLSIKWTTNRRPLNTSVRSKLTTCCSQLLLFQRRIELDQELARFIYVREVKRFDPFKFSIYAWYIKVAITGSLTPVRLAWVPFLRVPKNGFIYVEADTKKLYAGL